jgi:hypothetical protein
VKRSRVVALPDEVFGPATRGSGVKNLSKGRLGVGVGLFGEAERVEDV